MGNHKAVIAQVNTVDTDEVFAKQQEIEAAIRKTIEERNLDLFVFAATDILENDSVALALGSATDAVEEGFGVKLDNNKALLKGVVSRKKQIVPVITNVLNK